MMTRDRQPDWHAPASLTPEDFEIWSSMFLRWCFRTDRTGRMAMMFMSQETRDARRMVLGQHMRRIYGAGSAINVNGWLGGRLR